MRHVTFDDFLRFYRAKVPHTRCPSCGNDDWVARGLNNEGERIASFVYAIPKADSPKSFDITLAAQPTIYVECQVCGFLMLYSYDFVQNWIHQHPGEGDEG